MDRAVLSTLLVSLLLLCTSVRLVQSTKKSLLLKLGTPVEIIQTLYKDTSINFVITPQEKCDKELFQYYLRWIILKSHCMKDFQYSNNIQWTSNLISTSDIIAQFENTNCVDTNYNIGNPNQLPYGFQLKCIEDNNILGSNNWSVLSTQKDNEIYTNEYKETCNYKGGLAAFDNISTASVTPSDGTYLIVVSLLNRAEFDPTFVSFNIGIEIKSPNGYLTALDYPLLKFYLSMSVVYVLCALLWSIAMSVNFQYIGLYQNLIALIILLSTVENTLLYCNYLTLNSNAEPLPYASKLACVLGCITYSLLYGTLLCIGTGYGITKVRHRAALYPIFGVGILYFIVALIQGFIGKQTDLHTLTRNNNTLFFTTIPVIVIQFVIMCWVYMASKNTIKMAKEEINVKKTIMYRIFICFSLPYFIISILTASGILFVIDESCLPNWNILWKLNGSLKLYNLFILMILMLQWFPRYVAERYLFSANKDGEAFSLMSAENEF